MGKNSEYLLQNLDFEIPTCHWFMYIDNFFGKEKAEEFYEYLINARQIMRKNDIRKILKSVTLSIYSLSWKEQFAFIGIYKPINRNSQVIQNLEDGFIKAQTLYRNKNIQLAKEIKKLGYSFTTVYGNWKDKIEKDTYQQEKIFVIFSEEKNPEEFKKDMCNLVKEYTIDSALITEKLEDNNPNTKIASRLFDVKTENELKTFQDTTIEVVEKYFTDLHNTRFLFKIPYEKNKKILRLGESETWEYYSPKKQELVKKSNVHSCHMGMFKQSLIQRFSKPDYNC